MFDLDCWNEPTMHFWFVLIIFTVGFRAWLIVTFLGVMFIACLPCIYIIIFDKRREN